ncbi:MAG: hypothetical protein ACJ79K_04905 [Gemmatimonadaceae bacterium]
MYAIVRESTYNPAMLEQGDERIEQFQAVHARQPGYAGTVVIEVGSGRWLTINLWDTEKDATAALPVMAPMVQRLLEPMMAGPSRIIGAGRVVLTDLEKH